MPGMTHVQYRNKLVGDIRTAYRKLTTAKARVAKYESDKNEQKRAEWVGRMASAARELDEAFKRLPEVKAGSVDMDAMAFAESLIEDEGVN